MNTINQSFLNAIAEGVVVQRADGSIVLCNRAAEQILGLSQEQLAGRRSVDPAWHCIHEDGSLFPGETHPAMHTLRTGQAVRNVVMGVRKPDETLSWISINSEPVHDVLSGRVTQVVTSFSDITEVKNTSIRFKGIFNSMYQFIGLMSPDGTLLEANETALRFAGIQPEDVIGKKLWHCHWWSVSEEARERLRAAVEQAAAGTFVRYDEEIAGADGHRAIIDFSLKPLLDNQHRVVLLIPEGRDMTEQKRMETLLQEANRTLDRNNQALQDSNEELERFAYVASHDLQEPLRTISSFLQLLGRRLDGKMDADERQYLSVVVNAAARLKRLINDLLEYSRLGRRPAMSGHVDCNLLVANVVDTLGQQLQERNARVQVAGMPVVTGSETLLTQLFQNLINNGLKYNRSTAPLVTVGCEARQAEWEFCVKDNGIGIAPEFHDKVFTFFQRLHGRSEYEGTGMGLAICKKIVEQHGGRIWLESTPGQGSTFFFTLPN